MLLPIRSKNPPESVPFVTMGLIVANLVVYLATSDHFLEVKDSAVRQLAITGRTFDPLHILTSMFLHAGPTHLLGNMFFLYLFGFAVEGRMRWWKYLILYLLSGASGDLLHQLVLARLHPDIPALGASGAIMGVMGAALYIFPHSKITVLYGFYMRWGTVDWPMWAIALIYFGFEVLMALLTVSDGVGHFAHIGGAGAGFLIALAMRIPRDSVETSEAKATLAATKDLLVLSRLELEALHKVHPDDTAIVVNWVYRSSRDPGGVRDNCKREFIRLLPKIVREQEPGPVAVCILTMDLPPGSVPTVCVADLAARLERTGDNHSAMRLYERILQDPYARPDDRESATFRMGMLYESAIGNYAQAQARYREILTDYPMGPFAEQARTRLAYVTGRIAAGQP